MKLERCDRRSRQLYSAAMQQDHGRHAEERLGTPFLRPAFDPLDTIPTGRYVIRMVKKEAENAREKLLTAAIELIRRNGYVATTVDEICTEAGVTKGAFFHHFESKEALAHTCLQQWRQQFTAMVQSAPFHAVADPVDKLVGCMDFFISVFGNPNVVKSCLAGTVVQEVSESHPALRESAHSCFTSAEGFFQSLLDDACRDHNPRLDTASLAKLWMATLQGSFLLCKASRDETVIPANLKHVKQYIETRVAAHTATIV
jgi:TetR/AcrR family transcriptional repressor of nem operon